MAGNGNIFHRNVNITFRTLGLYGFFFIISIITMACCYRYTEFNRVDLGSLSLVVIFIGLNVTGSVWVCQISPDTEVIDQP